LQGRYYDLYTRQHGVDANMFLAPGEGAKDPLPEEKPKLGGAAVPTAASLLRGGIA
jgi:subfamily B ATP-binding cassette protein MsbA